ncbi:hypothetical protein RSAG8_09014, partial [Rhizoctonia solani AG-8 WAC10335]
MVLSARDLVNSNLANTQTDSETRLDNQSAENETQIGLYDYPPDDPRSREHVSGRRKSRSTERNIQYRARRNSEERTRQKSNDTRAWNKAGRRTKVQDPATQGGSRPTNSNPTDDGPDSSEPEAIQASGRRGRSRTIHAISRSPSPASTDHEQDQPTQVPASETQYTYVYETLNHEGLVKHAQEEFGIDIQGCDTQTIIDRL